MRTKSIIACAALAGIATTAIAIGSVYAMLNKKLASKRGVDNFNDEPAPETKAETIENEEDEELWN